MRLSRNLFHYARLILLDYPTLICWREAMVCNASEPLTDGWGGAIPYCGVSNHLWIQLRSSSWRSKSAVDQGMRYAAQKLCSQVDS